MVKQIYRALRQSIFFVTESTRQIKVNKPVQLVATYQMLFCVLGGNCKFNMRFVTIVRKVFLITFRTNTMKTKILLIVSAYICCCFVAVQGVSKGIYFAQLVSESGIAVKKVVVIAD